MIGNMLEIGFGILVCLCWIMRSVGWRMLLVMRSTLHDMVDFPGL
jgi:hypothetical protein